MQLNQSYLDQFENFSINNDNIAEIKKLSLLRFEDNAAIFHQNCKLVLVLVEPRLIQNSSVRPGPGSLLNKLKRLKEDLTFDGYRSRFILTDLYRGERHQDGRSVLAVRSFFKQVRRDFRNLKGAVLIGSFPEAMLVRRCIWRMDPGNNEERKVEINGTKRDGVYMMLDPEIISDRSDIVLADLMGHWDRCYREGPEDLESIYAVAKNQNWSLNDGAFESKQYARNSKRFEDFFWINDSIYEVTADTGSKLEICYTPRLRNPEVTAMRGRRLPNRIARPDIFISRINPLHIAVDPDPDYQDINGNRFLAADGKPQAVVDPQASSVRHGILDHRNPGLERKLLNDYLDRNHAWRKGDLRVFIQCATIAYPQENFDADSLASRLGGDRIGYYDDTTFDNASLLDYVNFLKVSAMIKGVIAHSSPWNTSFSPNYNLTELEKAVGGRPWRWKKGNGHHYEPSLADQGGHADVCLGRTIFENKVLKGSSSCFYLHAGCEVNSPQGAASSPYNAENYGSFQNAEGILFYLKGLAIVSRAKIFSDSPDEFINGFLRSRHANVGDGFYAYFQSDENDANLGKFENSASNKRTYTWSIIGDWTLKRQHTRVPILRDPREYHASGFTNGE